MYVTFEKVSGLQPSGYELAVMFGSATGTVYVCEVGHQCVCSYELINF